MKDGRIESLWEKFGTWAAVTLFAFSIFYVQKMETRVEKTESAIVALSIEKVSRPELKDLENRFSFTVDSMRKDIIERMDWHFDRDRKNRN